MVPNGSVKRVVSRYLCSISHCASSILRVAGWWAVQPGRSGMVPPPVDKGGLMNAVPGVDPSNSALYCGDGPADILDDALQSIVQDYQFAWGRAPSLEELQEVFRFCTGPMRRGDWSNYLWLEDFCDWLGVSPQEFGSFFPSRAMLKDLQLLWHNSPHRLERHREALLSLVRRRKPPLSCPAYSVASSAKKRDREALEAALREEQEAGHHEWFQDFNQRGSL